MAVSRSGLAPGDLGGVRPVGKPARQFGTAKKQRGRPWGGLRDIGGDCSGCRAAPLLLQVQTRGKSGMNPSDRDIAVLKIPLDIGSPPSSCSTMHLGCHDFRPLQSYDFERQTVRFTRVV